MAAANRRRAESLSGNNGGPEAQSSTRLLASTSKTVAVLVVLAVTVLVCYDRRITTRSARGLIKKVPFGELNRTQGQSGERNARPRYNRPPSASLLPVPLQLQPAPPPASPTQMPIVVLDQPCGHHKDHTKLERHAESSHGDVCRDSGGFWACPRACTPIADKGAPFCVSGAGTQRNPCRAPPTPALAPAPTSPPVARPAATYSGDDGPLTVPKVAGDDPWMEAAVAEMLAPWHAAANTVIKDVVGWMARNDRAGGKYCVVAIRAMELLDAADLSKLSRLRSCPQTNRRYVQLLFGAMDYLKRHQRTVPDQTLVLTKGDDEPVYPKLPEWSTQPPPLIVSQITSDSFYDVTFPTTVRKGFMGNFQRRFMKMLDESKPFAKKNGSAAVWRGAPGSQAGCGEYGKYYYPNRHFDSGAGCTRNGLFYDKWPREAEHPRFELVNYSVYHPECADARFHNGMHETSFDPPFSSVYPLNTGKDDFRGDVMEFADYKFVLVVANNIFSDRIAALLAKGCVVLFVDNRYREWYYPALIPFVHYVPIKMDLTDLCAKLALLKRNPEAAATIAANGRAFVKDGLRVEDRHEYIAEVLKQWGALWNR